MQVKSIKKLGAAAIVLLALTLPTCKQQTPASPQTDYPLKVQDTVIESCPQRVVCLSPDITEIIEELGSDAQLIGVSDQCDTDKELPAFGSTVLPDTANIIDSKADLVFASSALPAADRQQLLDAGIDVIVLDVPTELANQKGAYQTVAQIMSGLVTGKMNAEYTFSRLQSKNN
jgi:iron complex transport system substrate-binding protein